MCAPMGHRSPMSSSNWAGCRCPARSLLVDPGVGDLRGGSAVLGRQDQGTPFRQRPSSLAATSSGSRRQRLALSARIVRRQRRLGAGCGRPSTCRCSRGCRGWRPGSCPGSGCGSPSPVGSHRWERSVGGPAVRGPGGAVDPRLGDAVPVAEVHCAGPGGPWRRGARPRLRRGAASWRAGWGRARLERLRVPVASETRTWTGPDRIRRGSSCPVHWWPMSPRPTSSGPVAGMADRAAEPCWKAAGNAASVAVGTPQAVRPALVKATLRQ